MSVAFVFVEILVNISQDSGSASDPSAYHGVAPSGRGRVRSWNIIDVCWVSELQGTPSDILDVPCKTKGCGRIHTRPDTD